MMEEMLSIDVSKDLNGEFADSKPLLVRKIRLVFPKFKQKKSKEVKKMVEDLKSFCSKKNISFEKDLWFMFLKNQNFAMDCEKKHLFN